MSAVLTGQSLGGDICYIIGSSFLFLSVEARNGQHVRRLQPSQIPDIFKWGTIYATVLFIGALFTKCSIALFILRIIGKSPILSKTKLTLYAIMVGMIVATIILVALWFSACTPLEKVWNRKVPGTCLPAPVVHSVAYAQSGFAIATDLLLSLAPICVFWSLQISTKRKIGTCFLMSLGLAATITSILKSVAITKIRESDFSFDSALSEILAALEVSLGIVAACIPTFMQLSKSVNLVRSWRRITKGFHSSYASAEARKHSGTDKEYINSRRASLPASTKPNRDPYSIDDAQDSDVALEVVHAKDGPGEQSYVVR